MEEIIVKSEIYIFDLYGGYVSVKIYSHVKQRQVWRLEHRPGDVFYLLEDLHVNPDNTIIHIAKDHVLYPQFEKLGYTTRQSIFI